MAYSYKLRNKEGGPRKNCYTREQLEGMPAFMLQEICVREKIMTNSAGVSTSKLGRKELEELILRYRGETGGNFMRTSSKSDIDIANALLRYGRELEEERLEVPALVQLYPGVPLSVLENLRVEMPEDKSYTHAFLISSREELWAVFQIVSRDGRNYLVMEKEWMSQSLGEGTYHQSELVFFDQDTASKLIPVYNGEADSGSLGGRELFYVRKHLNKVVVSRLAKVKTPLIIDFGTSNTTAAYCSEGGEVVYIRFQQKPSCDPCTECGRCYLYPSAAAVEQCAGGAPVRLSFGHEALRERRREGCLSEQTYFYDMKRFAGDYEEEMEVTDPEGRTGLIKKREIVRQYLLNVIQKAEEHQKCRFTSLCFTTPVKQKRMMFSMYRAALPEYDIRETESIDEGIAVLYHEIEERRKCGNLSGREGNMLIMDIGGGTSDLVCCKFKAEDTGIAYWLSIDESYSNGDTNFGGNNLTYRILQYLKQKLYCQWQEGPQPEILTSDFFDPYNAVDDYGDSKNVYEEFEKHYAEAESLIPTQFAEELKNSSVRYIKIRSNFYSLWKLAEEIKKTFFQEAIVPQISVAERFPEYSSVFVNEKGRLRERRVELTVTKEEIVTVITPDIYSLVKHFLEPLCDEEGILEGYGIKLSGQTCRIPAFREAVKEFTVGQRSRSRRAEKRRYGLKLNCIDGAVKAWKNQKYGYVLSQITYHSAFVPYRLTAKTYSEQEVELISYHQKLSEVSRYLSRHVETREVRLHLYSSHLREDHEITLKMDSSLFSETTYEALRSHEAAGRINQAEIDTIQPEEMRLFLFGDEQSWGFQILPIARRGGALCIGKPIYVPFEASDWKVDFFDGHK